MRSSLPSIVIKLRPRYRLRRVQGWGANLSWRLTVLGRLPGLVDVLKREFGSQSHTGLRSVGEADRLGAILRAHVRRVAGLPAVPPSPAETDDLVRELRFLWANARLLKPYFRAMASRRVLYSGQCYYNTFYLSRAMRERGWRSDVLSWDANPGNAIFYHGEDFRFSSEEPYRIERDLEFYVASLYRYDVYHFSNVKGICFGFPLQEWLSPRLGQHAEIHLLRKLGKKICYTNNGCQDGVLQSSFAKWGPESVCGICRWQTHPEVCGDEKNRAWGEFRNSVTDYQCLLGGNRADFNCAPTVHEAPEAYCLDPSVWDPLMRIPEEYRLAPPPEGTVRLYHAVGNMAARTRDDGVNVKSTHVYLPLIKKLRAEGMKLELLQPENIPNKELRFLQMQADIFLDMLTFGWFGANAREAMMLAKPVICYLRPEWITSLRKEIPDYADELPIVSATPDTVESVLRELIENPEKRKEIGRKSRKFAMKWHSNDYAAERFDEIYSRLLTGDPLLNKIYA